MKKINLKNQSRARKSGKGWGSSSGLGTFVLLTSFLIYGVLFGLNFMVESKKDSIQSEIKKVEKTIKNEDFVEMYEFNVRLIDLESRISQQGLSPQTDNIIQISKNTIPEVQFLRFGLEDKGSYSAYNIELLTTDYATLIRQIKAYKMMENTHNFFLQSTKEENNLLVANFVFEIGEQSSLFDDEGESGNNF